MTEQHAPQTSPLSEADPQSLDELFSRLDQHITLNTLRSASACGDLDAVVRELRRQRAAWAKAEAEGKVRAPKATKATPKIQTTLDDLGLD